MSVTPQNQTKPHKTKPNIPRTRGHVILSCGPCMVVFGLFFFVFSIVFVFFGFGDVSISPLPAEDVCRAERQNDRDLAFDIPFEI